MSDQLLEKAARYVREAKRVVVFTGAGVSAESGVPTFRGGGNTAVWRGMPATELSSAELLERDAVTVWEWFEYRRGILAGLSPNPAHYALAEAEKRYDEFLLVTQNVDGLHQRAGSTKIIELHGNIWRGRPFGSSKTVPLPDTPLPEIPPKGPNGEVLRPDVVLFGEMLPAGAFEEAATVAASCDVCLVVGTSALVYPAARIPEIAGQAGAAVIEINPEETRFSDFADVSLRGPAGEIVPKLFGK